MVMSEILLISITSIAIVGIIVFGVFQYMRGLNDGEIKKIDSHREKLIIEVFRDMTFEEFVSPVESYLKTVTHSTNYLNNMIGDMSNHGIQSIRLINDHKYVLANYPSHIAKKLGQGSVTEVVIRESGEKILIARDGVTGRFLAHAQKAESATKFNKLATLGNLIVGTAHIISGYDNAKKLGNISKDISKLVTFRSSDMISELESIYESLQEFDSENIERDRIYLKAIKHDLKVLRNRWYREIFSALNHVEDPNEWGILKRWFTKKRTAKANYAEGEALCLEPLHIIRRSLEIERSVSIALGEEENFTKIILHNQYKKVIKLKEKIVSKRKEIEKFLGAKDDSIAGFVCESDDFLNSLGIEVIEEVDLSKNIKKIS